MTNRIDRRDFTRLLAAGMVAVVPLASVEQAAAADTPAEKPREDQDTKGPAALVVEMIKQQYPEGLEAEHLVELRQKVAFHQARSRVLASFPLTNADEPAFVFGAYRAS